MAQGRVYKSEGRLKSGTSGNGKSSNGKSGNETKNNQRGRPAKLSRDVILEAARSLSRTDFSFQDIANQLGVSPQSLYHYFASKEELCATLAEDDMESIPAVDPTTLEWRDYCRAQINVFVEWMTESKQPAHLFQQNSGWTQRDGSPNLNFLGHVDKGVGALTDAGFSPREAMNLCIILTALTVHAHQPDPLQNSFDRARASVEDAVQATEKDALANLRNAIAAPSPHRLSSMFDTVIELVIAGAAARYEVD